MLIDPFTVIAQVVNFVILVVALKHFLYQRVIDAMDRREAAIAERIEEAEQREAAAAAEAEQYRERTEELDRDRRRLLEEARAEAHQHRQQLLDEARADVDEERRHWERGLHAERHELHRELQRRATREVLEVSRKALADLAGAELDEAVIRVGLAALAADADTLATLGVDTAGAQTPPPLTVRTAFELDEVRRREVEQRLDELGLLDDRVLRFERAPELLFGLEVQGDGTTVSWNAADYLDRLGETVDELVATVEAGDDDD